MKKPDGHPFEIGQRVRSNFDRVNQPFEDECPHCDGTGKIQRHRPPRRVLSGTVIGYGRTFKLDSGESISMVRVCTDGSNPKYVTSTFADDWEHDPR